MRWLRSTWRLRFLVALMATSLLPLATVMPEQGSPSATTQSHVDWLRAEIEDPPEGEAGEAFQRALAQARDAKARTYSAFVRAFVDAYRSEASAPSLAELFNLPDLTDERLVRHLQRRSAQVSGRAVAPSLRLVAHTAGSSMSGGGAWPGTLALPSVAAEAGTAVMADQVDTPVWSSLIRILFSAQPLGP